MLQLTYDELEVGVIWPDASGTLSDVLLHFLVVLFEETEQTFTNWGMIFAFEHTPLDSFSASELLRLYVLPTRLFISSCSDKMLTLYNSGTWAGTCWPMN
jgi:hypothetical protein